MDNLPEPSVKKSCQNWVAAIAPGLIKLGRLFSTIVPLELNKNGNQVKTVHSPFPNGINIPYCSGLPSPLRSIVSFLATSFKSSQVLGNSVIPACSNNLGR